MEQRSSNIQAEVPGKSSGAHDPLARYVKNVGRIHTRFDRIIANAEASAESLRRAAAALRAMPAGK